MKQPRLNEAIAGALVLGTALTVGVLAFRARILGPPTPPPLGTFVAYFDDVGDLESDAAVVVRGLEVGHVVALDWVARGYQETPPLRPPRVAPPAGHERMVVAVHFDVFHGDLPLDLASASVALDKPSLLGDSWLELDPGHWPAGRQPRPLGEQPMLARRAEIRSRVNPSFESVVAQAQPLLDKLDRAVAVLETKVITAENGELLTASIRGLDESLDTLGDWLDPEAEGGLKTEVLTPLDELLRSLQARLDELGPAVQSSGQLVTTATETITRLQQTMESVERFLEEDGSQLSRTLTTLRSTAEELSAQVEQALAPVPETLERVGAAVDENRVPLNETLRRLRSVMWRAEMLIRDLSADPSVLIRGGDGESRDAPPWDDTTLRRSARVPPYRQRDEGDGP